MRKSLLLNWRNLAIVALVAGMTSCASISTMQTARTTEQGSFGFGAGGSVVKFDTEIADSTVSLAGPLMEVMLRYGVTDKLDVGFKAGLIGTTGLDAKYMLVGDHESVFALSAGASAGYLSGDINGSEFSIIDFSVPVYASIHPTSWFSVYATPRYLLRITSDVDGSITGNWFGTTAGVRLGGRVGVVAEYSYMNGGNLGSPMTQFTGGLVFGIQ